MALVAKAGVVSRSLGKQVWHPGRTVWRYTNALEATYTPSWLSGVT